MNFSMPDQPRLNIPQNVMPQQQQQQVTSFQKSKLYIILSKIKKFNFVKVYFHFCHNIPFLQKQYSNNSSRVMGAIPWWMECKCQCRSRSRRSNNRNSNNIRINNRHSLVTTRYTLRTIILTSKFRISILVNRSMLPRWIMCRIFIKTGHSKLRTIHVVLTIK